MVVVVELVLILPAVEDDDVAVVESAADAVQSVVVETEADADSKAVSIEADFEVLEVDLTQIPKWTRWTQMLTSNRN